MIIRINIPHHLPIMQKLELNSPGSKSHPKIIIHTEKVAAWPAILRDYVGGEFAEVHGEGAEGGYYKRALASRN